MCCIKHSGRRSLNDSLDLEDKSVPQVEMWKAKERFASIAIVEICKVRKKINSFVT